MTDTKLVYIQRKSDGVLYEPQPKQILFHETKAYYKGYIGGVGSGKTIALCMDFFKYAVEYPGTIQVITAPSYRMLRDATLLTWNEWVPNEALKRWDAKRNAWIFWNGSEVWFRSTDDPESLRGPNINRFGMDEGGKDKHASWRILIGRIRRVTKYPDGREAPNGGVVVGNPKGYNWLWQVFVKHKTALHFLVRASSLENKHLGVDYLEGLKHEYSGVFYQQEVMGEFTAHEGIVYTSFARDRNVQEPDAFKARHKRFVGSIDWGFSNPMVGLIASLDGDDRVSLVDEIYQRRLKLEEFAVKLREMEKAAAASLGVEYPFDITYWCDPSDTSIGAGSMMQAMREMGFDVRKADNSILPGINAVQKRLEVQADGLPRLVVTPACVETINEFEQYSYDEYDPEKPFKDKPMKMNDHAMDALRYMVMSLESQDRVVSLNPGGLFI